MTESSVEHMVSNRSAGIQQVKHTQQVHPSMTQQERKLIELNNYMRDSGNNEALTMSERLEDRIRPSETPAQAEAPPKSLHANMLEPDHDQQAGHRVEPGQFYQVEEEIKEESAEDEPSASQASSTLRHH